MLCLWSAKQQSFKLVTRQILYLFIVQFWQHLPWKKSLLWCYCCWLDREIICQSKYVGGIVMRCFFVSWVWKWILMFKLMATVVKSQSDSVQQKVWGSWRPEVFCLSHREAGHGYESATYLLDAPVCGWLPVSADVSARELSGTSLYTSGVWLGLDMQQAAARCN